MQSIAMETVTAAMQRLAPLSYAEEWDNVGLIVEPTPHAPGGGDRVHRILLTIDLTRGVLEEAVERGADLIIAYHPPIFSSMKRLTMRDPKQEIILRAIEAGIAIYSPHTALDSAPGGVNDWLADGLGSGHRHPLQQHTEHPRGQEVKLVTFVPAEAVDDLRYSLSLAGAGRIGNYAQCSFNLNGIGTFVGNHKTNPTVGEPGQLERVEEVRMEMVCSREHLSEVVEVLRHVHPYEEPAFDIYPLRPRPAIGVGQGRVVTLDQPISLDDLIGRVKSHLSLKQVRAAVADPHRDDELQIQTIALCAGAGGSVLKGHPAEVYLTGEMRHHDILAAVENGTSVILTDHTNTERGYLPILKKNLGELLPDGLAIDISTVDCDPLAIV